MSLNVPADKQCLQCGKIFTPSKNDSRIVFCCTDCRLKHRKESGYMEDYYHANLKKWNDRLNSREHRDARNEARRKKYAEDEEYREREKKKVREYNKRNPDSKKSQRLKKYGITLSEYNEMLEKQSGECAICGEDGSVGKWGKLYVDHDHKTGKVRGLLCSKCNFAIGQFNDDYNLLLRAISYLKGEI